MTPSVSILFRRGERGRGSAKGTRIGHPMMWKTGSGAARAVASAARRRSRRIDRHPSAVARDQKGRKALPRAPLSFELLHDLEELIVRVLLVLQTLLELTKIRERLLLAQRVVRRCLLHRGRGHALHGLRHTRRSPRVRFCVGRSAPPDASPGKVAFERARSNRGAGGRRGARDVRPSIGRVLPRAALSALEEARGSLPLPNTEPACAEFAPIFRMAN